jgi:hypothetical protein
MPRVSGVYYKPAGIDAVNGAVIESADYNLNVADVETDLNTPRPIVAGGTGATTAPAAIANLSGELAYQIVDNYSTFPFVAGSFYSAPGATGAPDGTHYFAGICYVAGTSLFLQARAFTGVYPPQPIYVREKSSGTWGNWAVDSQPLVDAIATKVAKAGDTMTGALTLNANPAVPLHAATKQYVDAADITKVSKAGDTMTGALAVSATTNSSSPTTGAVTSAGGLGVSGNIYSGGNVVVGAALAVNSTTASTTPTTGAATVAGGVGVNGDVTAHDMLRCGFGGGNATVQFGTSGQALFWTGAVFTLGGGPLQLGANSLQFGSSSQALFWDGSLFNLGGGPLKININTASTNPTTGALQVAGGAGIVGQINSGGAIGCAGAFACLGTALGGTPGYTNTNVGYSITGTGTVFHSSAAPSCATFNINADGANVVWLRSGVQVGSVNVTTTTTSYVTSSDARLKKDLQPFDAGPILDQINAFEFTWISTNGRAHGVMAQEVIEVFAEAVTHDEQNDIYGVDYSKFVPLLLQEIKNLRARVAALEAI